jgi:hypothetical protein
MYPSNKGHFTDRNRLHWLGYDTASYAKRPVYR